MLEAASSRFSRFSRDGALPGDAAEAGGEGDELLDIDLIGPARFGIGEVGEPFELGNVDEIAELGRGEWVPERRDSCVCHSNLVLFHATALPAI
jgi:hypothetical protein